jgi:hypothetical protein
VTSTGTVKFLLGVPVDFGYSCFLMPAAQNAEARHGQLDDFQQSNRRKNPILLRLYPLTKTR